MRAANYVKTLRRDLLKVSEACGVEHPALIEPSSVELLDANTTSTPLDELFEYQEGWGLPSAADRDEIVRLMTSTEPQGGSAPPSADAVG